MYLPLIFLWFRWFAWHMIMSQPQQSSRGKLRREIRTGMLQLHLRVGIAARNQARGEEMAWSMCWGVVWKLSLSGTCHQCLMCNINNWADFWEHSETVTLSILPTEYQEGWYVCSDLGQNYHCIWNSTYFQVSRSDLNQWPKQKVLFAPVIKLILAPVITSKLHWFY